MRPLTLVLANTTVNDGVCFGVCGDGGGGAKTGFLLLVIKPLIDLGAQQNMSGHFPPPLPRKHQMEMGFSFRLPPPPRQRIAVGEACLEKKVPSATQRWLSGAIGIRPQLRCSPPSKKLNRSTVSERLVCVSSASSPPLCKKKPHQGCHKKQKRRRWLCRCGSSYSLWLSREVGRHPSPRMPAVSKPCREKRERVARVRG
jgi:hypothetical protein